MYSRSCIVVLFMVTLTLVVGERAYAQQIQWLSWEEAIQKSVKGDKKFFVDVYTDWCGWCKRMDANTFADPVIASYINQHYYPIKFNASSKQDIVWKGKTYRYVANGVRGYHELAAEILQGQISYPTAVFMNEKMEVIQPIPGYHAPEQFEVIISYFAGNHYQSTPWRKYQDEYKGGRATPVKR
jgi:thioredoxin-related protein